MHFNLSQIEADRMIRFVCRIVFINLNRILPTCFHPMCPSFPLTNIANH